MGMVSLLRGWDVGDGDLQRLCREEYPRLLGMLALHVGDRWVAEELAQDAIVELSRQWPKVRSMQRPRAWLARVAMNKANSWWRRKYAERRAMDRLGALPEAPAAADVVDALAVREAVSALPRRQREALVLRYYAGLTSAEVAEHMGCAPSTVRVLTHQAINGLRDGGLQDPEGRVGEVEHA